METYVIVIIAFLCAIAGALIGAFAVFAVYRRKKTAGKDEAEEIIGNANAEAEGIVNKANAESQKIISNAKNDAEREAKQIQFEARQKKSEAEQLKKEAEDTKAETERLKKEAEDDIAERKKTIAQSEQRNNQKEDALDKREDNILKREDSLDQRKTAIENKEEELDQREEGLSLKEQSILTELEKVAKMTTEEAADALMQRVEQQEAKRIALFKEQAEEEAQTKAADNAKQVMCLAMEKYAQDVTSEHSTSSVSLPNDELKGRIIGREGRNIKSMEALFGVSLIIDDTPETITVSCFDPIRREKAKLTLEALIRDGRIQPGRIEEVYKKVSDDFDESLRRIGEQTVFKLGLPRISQGLLPYIGRLKYRTSFGQNVLDHSIQVAYLASVMASELGLDSTAAKRAGLLHDIGKAIDAEQEGSHVQLGVQLARKYGEPDVVVNAIESHHGDAPKRYLISELVTAADTLSAARPGARSETLETYIKRIEQLETICKRFDGVQSSYALQSGRDVRIMVVPEKVSDEDAIVLASQIRDAVEAEMQFPGQIKISVIRETRAVQIAK